MSLVKATEFNPFVKKKKKIAPKNSFDETWEAAQELLKNPLIREVQFTFWGVLVKVTRASEKRKVSQDTWDKSPLNPTRTNRDLAYYDDDTQFDQGGNYVG